MSAVTTSIESIYGISVFIGPNERLLSPRSLLDLLGSNWGSNSGFSIAENVSEKRRIAAIASIVGVLAQPEMEGRRSLLV
jgi:hypothetical protein